MISSEHLREFAKVTRDEWENRWKQSIPADYVDDVVQELSVQYVTRPFFREVIDTHPDKSYRAALIRFRVKKIFGEYLDADRLADNQETYSVESVKEVFKGTSTNKHLVDLMPLAMIELGERHAPYFGALHQRYKLGIKPPPGPPRDALKNAHVAITEEINQLSRGDWVFRDGPQLRDAVGADNRAAKGGTGDPTGMVALALMNASAEDREGFFDESGPGVREVKIPGPSNDPGLNLFDPEMQGVERLDMYRSWVFPDLYPKERPACRDNWSDEESGDYR